MDSPDSSVNSPIGAVYSEDASGVITAVFSVLVGDRIVSPLDGLTNPDSPEVGFFFARAAIAS